MAVFQQRHLFIPEPLIFHHISSTQPAPAATVLAVDFVKTTSTPYFTIFGQPARSPIPLSSCFCAASDIKAAANQLPCHTNSIVHCPRPTQNPRHHLPTAILVRRFTSAAPSDGLPSAKSCIFKGRDQRTNDGISTLEKCCGGLHQQNLRSFGLGEEEYRRYDMISPRFTPWEL